MFLTFYFLFFQKKKEIETVSKQALISSLGLEEQG
jgi:hypothetical protein